MAPEIRRMPTRRGYTPCVSALCRVPACLVFPASNTCHACRWPKQPHADWGDAGCDFSPAFRHFRSACLALLILLKLLKSMYHSGGLLNLLEWRPDSQAVVPGAILTNPRVKKAASFSPIRPVLLSCAMLLCYVFDSRV